MYIGIDLGTSGIKVILLGENGKVIDSASAELLVSRPRLYGQSKTRSTGGLGCSLVWISLASVNL
jgi:activator of 2-hydroxyglutaryl-CoA dehydratase